MTRNTQSENNKEKNTSRLNRPAWQILSIIMTTGAIVVFLYSTARDQLVIPISAAIVFLMLWLWPAIWDGIIFLFSKRPGSIWGRISMNLVIATILAVIIEDFYELALKFAWFILRTLR